MIRRNKTYRVLVSGYFVSFEQTGHFSGMWRLPYDRLNAARKIKLETQIRQSQSAQFVAITGFQVNNR